MLQLIYFICLLHLSNGHQPEFTRNIPNLSIVQGKDAFLRCSVSNIGENKIIWTYVDSQQLISIQEHIIEDKNGRISIQVVGGQLDTLFELRINNISLEDRGYYMCQIQCLDSSLHTCVSKSQVGYLNVVVPPKFDESVLLSDSNYTIREFEDVNILCSASGNPKPSIYWKREDVYLNEHNIRGNRLHIQSANRQDAGVYICVASNGVQPSISRRIHLVVEYAPMIRIVTQVLPAYVGDNVKLECQTESFPLAEHYFLTPNGSSIHSPNNYANENELNNVATGNLLHKRRHRLHGRPFDESLKRGQTNRKYQVRLKKTIQYKYLFQMHISYVTHEDTGQYVCVATNHIGEARSAILLKVNDRSHPKHSNTAITIKSFATPTKAIDNVANEKIHASIHVHLKNEDNHLNHSNQRTTQLLKSKKNSSPDTGQHFYLLLLSILIVTFCNF